MRWLSAAGSAAAESHGGVHVLRRHRHRRPPTAQPQRNLLRHITWSILREAEVLTGGLRLGRCRGRIVGAVFIGLLQLDPTSYLTAKADYRPQSRQVWLSGLF